MCANENHGETPLFVLAAAPSGDSPVLWLGIIDRYYGNEGWLGPAVLQGVHAVLSMPQCLQEIGLKACFLFAALNLCANEKRREECSL